MKRDATDRQITRLIQADPISWGVAPPADRDCPARLWDRIYRARRIRRTCLCVALNMLALFVGSLLVGFLWDGSGVNAFKEGVQRDIRPHGDSVSIEYRDDHPREPSASFAPIHREDASIADVESLDFFVPVPTALPEDMVFAGADITYMNPEHGTVMLSYRDQQDRPMLIFCLYGKRNISMGVQCDTVRVYDWDGIEVTRFIHEDPPRDMWMWHIGEYMFEVHTNMDMEQARVLFDDINAQVYTDWKQGDWQ